MSPEASSPPLVRREVAGYELLDVVGRGPLGVVYRARATDGANAAVKVFSAVVSRSPGFVASFEQDTGIVASLRHPNVLALRERGRAGDDYFVAYDFMPGGSLREQLRREPLGLKQALRVGAEIGWALEHAHQRRMLHRGLKPENVFLLASGSVKVSDFGQTRLGGHELQIGRYSPPEERRMSLQRDGRADVYAATIILHEMLTGQAPAYPWQPVASKVAGAGEQLDAFLRRALAPDPSERFLRAGEWSAALARLVRHDAQPAETFDNPVAVTVKRNVVRARLRQSSAEALEWGLKSVEQALSGPDRKKLVYDLTEVRSLGTMENAALIALHQRCRDRLDTVYFHSPISHVRGSALVVGGSVQGLPFRVFDSAESMRRCEGEGL